MPPGRSAQIPGIDIGEKDCAEWIDRRIVELQYAHTSPISTQQYVAKLSPDGLRFLRKVHRGERDGMLLNRD